MVRPARSRYANPRRAGTRGDRWPCLPTLVPAGLRSRGDHWSVDRYLVDPCGPVAFPRITTVLGLGDLDGYSGRRSQRKDPRERQTSVRGTLRGSAAAESVSEDRFG